MGIWSLNNEHEMLRYAMFCLFSEARRQNIKDSV